MTKFEVGDLMVEAFVKKFYIPGLQGTTVYIVEEVQSRGSKRRRFARYIIRTVFTTRQSDRQNIGKVSYKDEDQIEFRRLSVITRIPRS